MSLNKGHACITSRTCSTQCFKTYNYMDALAVLSTWSTSSTFNTWLMLIFSNYITIKKSLINWYFKLAIGMYLWQCIWSHSIYGSNRFYFLNIEPNPKSLIIKTIFVLDEWPSKSMSTNRSHIDQVQSKLFCNSIFQFLCGPEPISLVSGPGPQSWFCLCSNGFENDCNFVGSAS